MNNDSPNQNAAADLELEARLSKVLARLPDAPVASNFTARVMRQIDLEESRPSRKWNFIFNWHAFLPRAAVAAVAIVFAGAAFHHHEVYIQRAQVAKSIALVAGSQSLPSVEALKNFDVIQRMGQPQHADEDLLALMQ